MKVPKVLAMYLPQFHRIKENDEWWGEGFTEWSTVKTGKPLYSGHKQPIEPLEYYDLLNKEVMSRQAEYMHRYGVEGMCFYHYYFENGRQVLEKPAENLLKWTDIDMPFCFYWANESWIRSWSNVSGNSWTELFESEEAKNNNGVLLKQNYGDRSTWEAHFNYLLPFFRDSRYLKKEGRPIFIIYNPGDIEHLEEMKACWDELMKREGLPPVFFIGKDTDRGILNKAMLHEPMHTWSDLWEKRFQNPYGFQFYLDYDEVWERILKRRCTDENGYLGGFVGFDDTPRRGYKGKIMYGGTPDKFKKYMIRLLLKAGKAGNEFIFINAWNEWGEGMYLEPDKQWGFQYLEAVKEAGDFVKQYGDIVELSWSDSCFEIEESGESDELRRLSEKSERYGEYWRTLRRWLLLNLQGKTVCGYFAQNKYGRIAIYGLGMLGVPFVEEMRNHHIPIAYGIDQDEHKGKKFDFPVYRLQDELPETDIIIITVGHNGDVIKQQIAQKKDCKIVLINELLDYLEEAAQDQADLE